MKVWLGILSTSFLMAIILVMLVIVIAFRTYAPTGKDREVNGDGSRNSEVAIWWR